MNFARGSLDIFYKNHDLWNRLWNLNRSWPAFMPGKPLSGSGIPLKNSRGIN